MYTKPGREVATKTLPAHLAANASTRKRLRREAAATEEYHLTAIHQMDTAPYRVAQPMARDWNAAMLR